MGWTERGSRNMDYVNYDSTVWRQVWHLYISSINARLSQIFVRNVSIRAKCITACFGQKDCHHIHVPFNACANDVHASLQLTPVITYVHVN